MARRRVWKVLALVVVLAVVGVGGLGFSWWQGGRAQRTGTARLAGLSAEVQVRWDAWGVPHVLAAADLDAATALGWLHANDRLFQLELGRRSCSGRLSEVLGERALPLDRRQRILRLRRTAEALVAAGNEGSRRWLEAYARGVDAWVAAHRGDLPPELRLLGIQPEPWQPADSLCFVVLMAQDLGMPSSGPLEDSRYRLAAALGAERAADLLGPPDLEIAPGVLEAGAVAKAQMASGRPPFDDDPIEPPSGLGSNNWAVGISRSTTGAPIVANDPHLVVRLPALWYQVHLRSPGYEAAGMTLPGFPVVAIGQTADLAWAFTATMLDDHDVFVEQLDPGGRRVRRGETWQDLRVEETEIRVKGAEPVRLTLLASDRGPLLPADPERGLPARSVAWTVYEPGDPLAPFLALARAKRVEELPERLDGAVAPALNLVAADQAGGLLFTVVGRVPERRAGDARFAQPGWDSAYGWSGLRPRSENPTVLRPAEDLLVTANHDIRPPGYEQPFAAWFDLPARAERIRERLLGQPRWDAEAVALLQSDDASLWAKQVVAALTGDWQGDARRAYEALARWDGRMALEGPSALFTLVEHELAAGIFEDEARQGGLRSVASAERLLRALRGEMKGDWFDDVATPAREERRRVVARALGRAWAEGRQRWGADPARWRYADLHFLHLDHPLGSLPVLGRLLSMPPLAVAGSATSPSAFGGSWEGGAQRVGFAPSMRWVSDLADPDRSRGMLLGGQAGHPGDRHYTDQTHPFVAGESRPFAWSEAAIARATASTLRLVP
ncbi:MAG TPA: penicillin acylase family protein [Thermoanaerobaculia bacterium]|nr:penicillin acylase family protein [Thermoanaerobaculia bacterium]